MFGFFDTYLLFFGLRITYYGIIIAIGMAIAVWLACVNCKKRGFSSNDILILACYIIPLAIIGARLYYVAFEHSNITSFWQVFAIWEGGMAIYGGVIGGAIAIGLYCLIHKKNFFDLADIVVVSLILGQAIGRLGCYFGGCCYGIPTEQQSLMWFPMSVKIDGVWHLSTMFYESAWNFAVFAVLMLLLYKVKFFKQRGSIGGMYLILYGIGRAWIEALRGDSLYLGSIKVSQLLSIILIFAGVALILGYYFYYRQKAQTVVTVTDKQSVEKQTPTAAIEKSEEKSNQVDAATASENVATTKSTKHKKSKNIKNN